MQEAVAGASDIISQLSDNPLEHEADWSKVRSMEVVQLLQERKRLVKEREKLDLTDIADFDEQVRAQTTMDTRDSLTPFLQYQAVHAYRLLEDKVASYVTTP